MADVSAVVARRAAVFAAIAVLVASSASAEEAFRELTLRLEHPVDSPPVSIRLPDGAGLIAVGRQEDSVRLSVISLADQDIIFSGDIPGATFFYDACDPGNRGFDQLCFLDERGVSALDPLSGEMSRVEDFSSIYYGVPAQPTYSDFVRDVDGDGADDILTAQFGHWLLALQHQDGFDQFLLEIPTRVTVFQNGVSYRPRQPRIGDVDGDGLNDVIFLLDREFLSFLQGPPGNFSTPLRRDPIGAPLASEKQRQKWDREDGQVDQSDLEIEEVKLVRDFNDDGILDLLTERTISEGVFDRRNEYHLYLGWRERDSLSYAGKADGSIASDGVQFEPLVVDVDGDGLLDIATPSTRLGLARIVGALFSGRISVDLDVYRMRAGGHYPDESDYRTRFKVEFDLKTGLMRYPAVAIADFDGDGHAELLVQEDRDELTLYPGGGDKALFGKDGQKLSLPLPRNGQMVEARDVDDDGRSDLVIRYGPADGSERVSELRVLLSVPPQM